MTGKEEEAFMDGQNSVYRTLLDIVLVRLPGDDMMKSKAQLIKELHDTRKILRHVCEDFGDNDWPDNLYLADVVEKHLWRNLVDTSVKASAATPEPESVEMYIVGISREFPGGTTSIDLMPSRMRLRATDESKSSVLLFDLGQAVKVSIPPDLRASMAKGLL